MDRGVFTDRSHSDRLTFDKALSRYLSEVVPTKKLVAQETDKYCAQPMPAYFGKYSLAAISPDLIIDSRGKRLAINAWFRTLNQATDMALDHLLDSLVRQD